MIQLKPWKLWSLVSVLVFLSTIVSGVVAFNGECHQWINVLDELQANVFDQKCNDQAREAIRLTFHDGIGRSAALEASGVFGGGGADGSIIKFADTELADPANDGLEDIVYTLKHFADNNAVSYGDIIQFAGAVALSNCPGSPRLAFYAGRPGAIGPTPPNLVPSPADSVDKILARMSDAGFTAEDTVALMAAHSVAVQKTIDTSIPDTPLDSTPGVFDTQFYVETLLKGTVYPGKGRSSSEKKSPFKHEFRLASDAAMARHAQTACKWQSFVDNQKEIQHAFSDAMMKLATQGHENLIDCSFIIPEPRVWDQPASYPPGTSQADIERSCSEAPFPPLRNATSSGFKLDKSQRNPDDS